MKILQILASVQRWILSAMSNMNKCFIDVDRSVMAAIKGFWNVLWGSAWLNKCSSVLVAELF